jgi:hypothetical protein
MKEDPVPIADAGPTDRSGGPPETAADGGEPSYVGRVVTDQPSRGPRDMLDAS